jgi:hypothetical protein
MKVQKKKIQKVFLLQHVREEDAENEDIKTIGIYSTRANAIIAKRSLLNKPGSRRQKNGFYINGYSLDQTFWIGGFVW